MSNPAPSFLGNSGPGNSGQALLEFVLSCVWISAVLAGCVPLVRAQWERTRCAYQVFEKAHARVTGRLEKAGSGWIRIIETPLEVTATGVCGGAPETVSLPRLEARKW